MTLFGEDTPAYRKPRTRPLWQAINGRRCDRCVEVANIMTRQFAHWQIAPARWRRIHEGTDMRLCYEHARPIRAQDTQEASPHG